MIVHAGDRVPILPDDWDPDDTDDIWIVWGDSFGAITQSEWVLPDGWTILAEYTDQTVVDRADGQAYSHANGVVLSTTNLLGEHTITNRVTFDGGPRRLDRSCVVEVRTL